VRIGIVYSPEIKKANLAMCRRLYGFERVIERLGLEFTLPESLPFSEHLLYEIHSREMIEKVKRFFAFSSTFKSAWAVYTAANLLQDYNVVIVPTSGTGHGAMRDRFKGYSFINDVNLAIKTLKELGFERIAIVDTDTHHGDGVFEYIAYDTETMYFCFCGGESSSNETKICIGFESEDDYIERARRAFKKIKEHRSDALIWYVGQDAHEGELSDLNLSISCFRKISEFIRNLRIKTLIILSGGTDEDVMEELSSTIIKTLLGDDI